MFQPSLGPWYSFQYWATGPTPTSGGFASATSFGVVYLVEEFAQVWQWMTWASALVLP